jgi:DNA (cytosine-5)-methyltransferase 1
MENKNKEQVVFKLGEFFSGPGGLALGAKNAAVETDDKVFSIQHEWANDFDKDTCNTYTNNICPAKPESVHCEDVRNQGLIEKLTPIDGFAFGFPCNDFSIVGEQKGLEGDYGALYSYGIKIIKKFEPKFFLAENVGGLRSANEGGALSMILQKLEECGYDVVPHYYKFEQYGVPQARHRVIFIGTKKELGLQYKVPAPTHEKPVTARTAIENPPILADADNNDLTNQSKHVIERLKHIKPGQNAFNATLPENLKLNVKGARMSQIYKRLDPDKPAYTITGSGGGGTHVYHWEENRALTNRERARLQTFPDDFVFVGSRESVRKQIGMAVPPLAAKIIFQSVLKCFAGIEYESVEANIDLQYILEQA